MDKLVHDPKEILKDAISLLPAERAYLIDRLLESLDKPDHEIDKLWAKEAEKRIDAYENGKIKSVPIDEVIAKYKDI